MAAENGVVAAQLEVAPTVPALEAIEPLLVESRRSQEIQPAEIVIAPMTAIPEVHVERLFREPEQQ